MLPVVNGYNVVDVRLLHFQNTTRKTQFVAFLQGLAESLQKMYLFCIENTTFDLSLRTDGC